MFDFLKSLKQLDVIAALSRDPSRDRRATARWFDLRLVDASQDGPRLKAGVTPWVGEAVIHAAID
ncbi:MAG: hypothetical protein WBA73_02350 [Devosia sp.]